MYTDNNFAVIMAGGIGSRFWPMSRTHKPKQFIDILGTGETLIQQTFNRLHKLCPYENILVVTNSIYRDLVAQQLPEMPAENILCEPCRRNTAPCICYAYNKIALKNPNARMIVAPSDHIIMKEDIFVDVAEYALESSSKSDCLITIGILPSRPDTGYGYIKIDNDGSHKLNERIDKVLAFKEKPNLETAKMFLADGNYVWNSGIFIWSVESIRKAFVRYLPDIDEAFAKGVGLYNTKNETDFVNRTYEACRNISIDFGVMEHANNVYVCRCDLGWSDLGTWVSLFENSPKNADNNVIKGNVTAFDSKNCIIRAPEGKQVAVLGIKDLIIIDEGDVLLICDKSKEQQIKDVVSAVSTK